MGEPLEDLFTDEDFARMDQEEHDRGAGGEGPAQEEEEATAKTSLKWPAPLAEEALHGLAGQVIKTIEPHSEADPAALLFSFLTLFGNVIGRQAYFKAEADKHYLNLFCCLVGMTAKGRKGVSLGQTKRLFLDCRGWVDDRIVSGLSSGEGLIWAVRDEQREIKADKDGTEREIITVEGVEDKRLTVIESELASTLRVLRREGNTLSPLVRKAWDDGRLQSLTKNSPAQATGAHISILGHITRDELLRYFDDVEAANGFGNRFLWACVRRSKCLPEGGSLADEDLGDLTTALMLAIDFARRTGELKRTDEARALWAEIYPELSEGMPGLLGAMLARSEAQVMRLACIYALLDQAREVDVVHLMAALAVWDYVEASAKYIFGDALGDPLADEILKLLRNNSQGVTRTEINNHFARRKSAAELDKALNLLFEKRLAAPVKEASGGRPVERWFATFGNTN